MPTSHIHKRSEHGRHANTTNDWQTHKRRIPWSQRIKQHKMAQIDDVGLWRKVSSFFAYKWFKSPYNSPPHKELRIPLIVVHKSELLRH